MYPRSQWVKGENQNIVTASLNQHIFRPDETWPLFTDDTCRCIFLEENLHIAVLWISGRPVAKCDPLCGRAIQHDHQSRPMGDPSPAGWEHDQTENMQILC